MSARPTSRELHQMHESERALERRERRAVEAAVLASEERAQRRMQALLSTVDALPDIGEDRCYW